MLPLSELEPLLEGLLALRDVRASIPDVTPRP